MIIAALLLVQPAPAGTDTLEQVSSTGSAIHSLVCTTGTDLGADTYHQVLDSSAMNGSLITAAQAASDAGDMTLTLRENYSIGQTGDGQGCLMHSVVVTAEDAITGVRGPAILEELVGGVGTGAPPSNPWRTTCTPDVGSEDRAFLLVPGIDVLTVRVGFVAQRVTRCIDLTSDGDTNDGSVVVFGELESPLYTWLEW